MIPTTSIDVSSSFAAGDITSSTGGTAKFFSGTGHYYEYVPGVVTWTSAKSRAEASTANGLKGYLATISSAQENDFLFSIIGGNTWIGASDAA